MPDAGYDGLSRVDVGAIPDTYIIPSGTKSITSNGTHNITQYASVNVNVPVPSGYIKTDDADATAADILSGKTAYVKGVKITGTMTAGGGGGGGTGAMAKCTVEDYWFCWPDPLVILDDGSTRTIPSGSIETFDVPSNSLLVFSGDSSGSYAVSGNATIVASGGTHPNHFQNSSTHILYVTGDFTITVT